MANIQSQIKRNRQTERARTRNKAQRSDLKTFMKKFDQAVDSGDKDAATAALRDAAQKLDKAVSSGLIKKNNAANKKSRMAARANAL
ncbi:SSU ribosomal protein S20p [Euzebya pacifica]|jgi:small subunit ribosomal protein S20|uniref:Small ribosomal subunit protein bS20 n=1 Tax=Euzebya pacifica TaxID=1608957 RepID=A0A346XVQ9_9ACTN|nr:30S ribosomal protein S20 [Euzebya pacifica]AXV06306.1 SSU ribosomal protein S20p [Euzebya pacifica]